MSLESGQPDGQPFGCQTGHSTNKTGQPASRVG